MVEQQAYTLSVLGSNPSAPTNFEGAKGGFNRVNAVLSDYTKKGTSLPNLGQNKP